MLILLSKHDFGLMDNLEQNLFGKVFVNIVRRFY